jgi:hypothetical protein
MSAKTSSARDRDVAVERFLRTASAGEDAAPTPACLDAESASALVAGTLAADELASVEAHVSSCARCQTLVATLARAEAAAPAEPRRAFHWLTWAAPVAAAATIVVWLAAPQVQEDAVVEMAPRSAPDLAPAPSAGARAASEETRGAPVAEPPASAAPRLSRDEARTDAAAADERAAVGENAPASRFMAEQAVAPVIEIASPDRAAFWRVAAGGVIERSTDTGATWERQVVRGASSVAAGLAVSSTVCWLVGRQGAVLLTTDGRTWRVLPAPAPVDLTAVRATDARTATVAGADGRAFRTSDAGETWTPVPLQEF